MEAELKPVPDAELHRTLEAWNDTARPYLQSCLHEQFAEQAARRPAAIAAACGDDEISFGDLDRLSNRLARELVALGVVPGSLVGICTSRSVELVAAMLAVLKAGAAYVPVEPAYPRERRAFMFEDARVAAVITHERFAGELDLGDVPVLCVDRDRARIDAHDSEPVGIDVDPGDLAYVIYTSGSTGKPKGVEITHRSVANLLAHMREAPGIDEDDVVASVTTPAFDLSVPDWYLPLTSGAKLAIASTEATLDAVRLGEELIRFGATLVQATPTVWAQLVDSDWAGTPDLTIVAGGETLSRELADDLLAYGAVWHAYGPTETTVWSSLVELEAGGGSPPLGTPIANTTMYVLDEHRRPVPDGVSGELYIGGDGLARGYHDRAQLTAERFVVGSPVDPDERLYRTGDLVRRQSDGTLEFLGRLDDQVKLRGFRIELGEVEAVLSAHAAVAAAAAVVREDTPSDRRLVAYVVAADGAAPSVSELRDHLRARLPQEMNPAAIVLLESLPVSANGKLDRAALPAPEVARRVRRRQAVAPKREAPAPSGDGNLTARLENLSPAQRALLEQRLMERRASAAKRNSVTRREVLSPCPLSYSQELLWLLTQVFNDGVAYNSPGAYRVQGPLDVELLGRSLEALVERHEVLRTTYSVIGDRPMQVVHDHMPVELNLIDLSHLPRDEQEAETGRILQKESVFAFDLVNGPVMRPTVIRHAPDDHVFMLCLHHIATDGYSRAIIYGDLTTLYESIGAGVPSNLAPLPIQYADYAVWHRRWLDDGAAADQLAYWKQKLAGAPSRLDLPADFQRPPVRAYVGAYRNQMLDVSLREGLRSVARDANATLFVALVSLFGTLLGRHAGQEDVVLGTPFAGRNRSEFEQMVGYFINPLALRLDLSGDPSFTELLTRTRSTVLDAFANADLPFETVVRETNPARDLSQTPVFQAMIVLHNPDWLTKRPKFEPQGLQATELSHEKGWAKFDLLLGTSERQGGLNTTWEYSTELFKAETIDQMVRHFRTLGESVAANPERPLSQLSMLSTDERRQVLGWSGDYGLSEESHSVKELFEAQAARTPDAPAVVFGDERLSFDELNRSANSIAWRLKEAGVVPGTFVGVMMNKSLELVPAVLAVIKSGGAYIPIDPQYPKDRIDFMLEDARPQVVLTHPELVGEVDVHGATVIAIDATLEGRDDSPPTVSQPDDLAYVIYTSGSTGRPKGAMITNRSLASAHFAYAEAYGLRSLKSHLQMASFSFDVFTGDLIRSLLAGAKMVLCPLEIVVDPPRLYELMERESVDMAEFVPATATLLFEWAADNGRRLDFMRVVVVSSEAWRNEKYEFFRSLCGPETRLINAYGLTEATIDSTYWEPRDGESLIAGRFVPIGRPLENTKIYVLDKRLEPMPVGVPGELCVGGVAVAQGYLNRPELNAEKFVPSPLGDGLLYRTGDLARWLPDGTVEFLGRTDRQVKIRGFRIEPGEIEAVLERHPAISQAVVTDRDARLVAYVTVADSLQLPEPDELRAFVTEHVPVYMVPAAWVTVDAFQLTPNGKVDVSALPEPEWDRSAAAEAFVAPSTETERAIAAVWKDVLAIEDVGVNDNFFDLGGHSLLAVRMVAEIERRVGVRLPLTRLFQDATVATLAVAIEEERGDDTPWESIVPLRTEGANPPLFLFGWVDGELLGYRDFVRSFPAGQPLYGLRAPGLDKQSIPYSTIEEIAAHFVAEVKRFQPEGPYLFAGFCFGGVVAYEASRQLAEVGQETAFLGLDQLLAVRPYTGPRAAEPDREGAREDASGARGGRARREAPPHLEPPHGFLEPATAPHARDPLPDRATCVSGRDPHGLALAAEVLAVRADRRRAGEGALRDAGDRAPHLLLPCAERRRRHPADLLEAPRARRCRRALDRRRGHLTRLDDVRAARRARRRRGGARDRRDAPQARGLAPEGGMTAVVDVWRTCLDQEADVSARLESLLSDDELARARRFRFPRDRARYVVGRGLLRSLAGRYVGVHPSRIRFQYGAHGKPTLAGDGPWFNLAHSGATAVYAFSASFEIGVDVELLDAAFAGDAIPERFFSPREVATLRALPAADQPRAFLTCWTRKEAFLKARGDGLTLALDSFDVTLAPDEPAAVVRTGWSPEEPARWQLVDLSDSERGHVAAIAAPATGWHCVDREIDITTVVYN